MSYSLSISGHVDGNTAEVDDLIEAKARELVEALTELGARPSAANFGGPTRSLNLLEEVGEPIVSELPPADADPVDPEDTGGG